MVSQAGGASDQGQTVDDVVVLKILYDTGCKTLDYVSVEDAYISLKSKRML